MNLCSNSTSLFSEELVFEMLIVGQGPKNLPKRTCVDLGTLVSAYHVFNVLMSLVSPIIVLAALRHFQKRLALVSCNSW